MCFFSHVDLEGKAAGSVTCRLTDMDGDGDACNTGNSPGGHATSMAGIIASNSASDTTKNGIAPDSRIYSISATKPEEGNSGYLAYALSHTVNEGIKIASASFGVSGQCKDYTALMIVVDRAVKEGLSYSTSIGNHKATDKTNTVGQHACGFNHITVGAVDVERDHVSLSRIGPAMFNTPTGDTGRIKPEITAIGVNVEGPTVILRGPDLLPPLTSIDYATMSGTSQANAVVAGASALILEKQIDYRPLEIKAALLIGADWKAISPATANDYDKRKAGVYDKMNKYGFGVLNIEKSLDYANDDDFPNIIYETNPRHENFADKQYRITVNEVDEQVKVLLSWFIHPRGTIINPTLPIASTTNSTHPGLITPQPFHNQIHDYDVNISNPDDTVIHTSDSDFQNNQFIVFNATQTGNYVITVSSNSQPRTNPLEPFVIASTHSLDKYPFETPIIPTSITFASTLSDDRSRITLQFSERLSKEFVPSDFTISDGTITSIQNSPNSAYRYLDTSGVPYNTDVTVRYTGTTYNLGTGTLELTTGTESVATGILIPPPPRPIAISFTDSFQNTLSSWTLSGNNEWETGTPQPGLSGQPGNKVLTSNNCNSQCIISLNSNLDTSSPLTITFDRFVDEQVSRNEGLYVQYSTDDIRWTTLASYTHNNRQDTDEWEKASLTLDIAQSSASMRFMAKSNHASEFVEMDNVSISPKVADTTRPTFTHVPPGETFEATGELTLLTAKQIGTATADDRVDPNPTIARSPTTNLFLVGTTTITWTATDSSGNIATATQRITIQDTTAPYFTSTIPDISRTFTTGTPAVISYDIPSIRDRADPDASVTCSPAPGSTFPAGPSTITCTATDRYGNSATSTSSVTVTLVTPTPSAPLNLAATSNIYGGFVTLSWDIPADDSVTGHRILRGLSPTSLSVLTSDTGSTTTTYTDASASPNTTYHYQVMSLNAFGASPASETISVTTPVARLASPDNFTVSFDPTDSEIDFRWM